MGSDHVNLDLSARGRGCRNLLPIFFFFFFFNFKVLKVSQMQINNSVLDH